MDVIVEIWKLLEARQRRRMLVLLGCAVPMGVATLVGIASAVPFFAMLGDTQLVHHNASLAALYRWLGFHDERRFIIALGTGFLALTLLANAINLLGTLVMNRFAHLIGCHFSVALFNEYLHRDYLFHCRSNSATLLSNVTWEVSRATTGILQSAALLVTSLVTGALIIASVCLVDPQVAVAAAAVLAGSYASIYLFARRGLLANGLLESRNTAERTRVVNESLGAIKEVTLVRGQELFRRKFAQTCRNLARINANTQAVAHSPRHILEVIAIGGLVGISLLLIGRGEGNGSRLAQLAFLGFAAYRLLPALQQIYHSTVRIRADRVAFDRLAEDLRHACRRDALPVADAGESPWPGRPHLDIRLEAVAFRYATDRPAALCDATLRIQAGALVGVVGSSGSGKTTLAELILGLLLPISGTVAVDGIALDEANRRHWQSLVAYLPQDIFLLDASFAENIALGVPAAAIDQQRVRQAARQARLDRFVEALPRGYAETVGEDGVRLSGGQRQRLGIARALYRDAAVLVMDEPTNALDGPTESEIIATLQEFRGERTIILITHRLDTLRHCDRIYELDHGTLIDSGTYDELLQRSAQFRSIAQRGRRPATAEWRA